MTDDVLHDAARWCARLAEVLGDVGRRAVELGQVVARDWPDARGHEWAERTSALGALLGREATASADLGESYARAGRGTGMRLGGTDAERVDDERGMRIAELDPPAPGR